MDAYWLCPRRWSRRHPCDQFAENLPVYRQFDGEVWCLFRGLSNFNQRGKIDGHKYNLPAVIIDLPTTED